MRLEDVKLIVRLLTGDFVHGRMPEDFLWFFKNRA